jgi:hypothetical protein
MNSLFMPADIKLVAVLDITSCSLCPRRYSLGALNHLIIARHKVARVPSLPRPPRNRTKRKKKEKKKEKKKKKKRNEKKRKAEGSLHTFYSMTRLPG